MPYVTDDGEPLTAIELAQRPIAGTLFDLRRTIVYRDPVSGAEYRAPAHDRTNLASVPSFLWSFIASYGRQTAPAIVHDHQTLVAEGLDDAAAFIQRREDDRVFRTALREQRVPLLRAWLMWVWVSVDRYVRHRAASSVVLLVQAVIGAIAVAAASVLVTQNPWWVALAVAPLLLAAAWGRDARLLIWLTYSLALLGPLVLLHLAALAPFRLIEAIIEIFSGGDPAGVLRPTILGPTTQRRWPTRANRIVDNEDARR